LIIALSALSSISAIVRMKTSSTIYKNYIEMREVMNHQETTSDWKGMEIWVGLWLWVLGTFTSTQMTKLECHRSHFWTFGVFVLGKLWSVHKLMLENISRIKGTLDIQCSYFHYHYDYNAVSNVIFWEDTNMSTSDNWNFIFVNSATCSFCCLLHIEEFWKMAIPIIWCYRKLQSPNSTLRYTIFNIH
jgi:hypothetical protein